MIINMDKDQPNEKIQEILQKIDKLSIKERIELFSRVYEKCMEAKDMMDDWDDEDSFYENDPDYDFPKTLPTPDVKKYTLRVTLKGIKPAIFRKFEVPSNITLCNLGELIVDLMGWDGSHWHQFKVHGIYYVPAWQNEGMEGDLFWYNTSRKSEEFTIGDVLYEKGKSIEFEYDFGDGWSHEVRLSSVNDYGANDSHEVRLIDGKRACPIEDCGGVCGYEALCAHYAGDNSFDKNYDDDFFDYYINDDFDPEFYDLQEGMNICKTYSEEIAKEEK